MRFKASTVVGSKILAFCVRTSCSFVVCYKHFGGTVQLVPSSECVQVTEAADCCKTLVTTKLCGYLTQKTVFLICIVPDYIYFAYVPTWKVHTEN